MARYRGSKGSISFGGNVVPEMDSWELQIDRPWMEATSMGDAAQKGDLDIPGGTGRASGRFDYGNTAHAAIVDALVSNDDTAPAAAVFIVATGKQLSCNVLPTSARIRAQRGNLVTVEFDFRTDGAISVAWA